MYITVCIVFLLIETNVASTSLESLDLVTEYAKFRSKERPLCHIVLSGGLTGIIRGLRHPKIILSNSLSDLMSVNRVLKRKAFCVDYYQEISSKSTLRLSSAAMRAEQVVRGLTNFRIILVKSSTLNESAVDLRDARLEHPLEIVTVQQNLGKAKPIFLDAILA